MCKGTLNVSWKCEQEGIFLIMPGRPVKKLKKRIQINAEDFKDQYKIET